jgi:hypothetical protein
MLDLNDINDIDTEAQQAAEASAYCEALQAQISILKSKLEYPPPVRLAVLGSLVGTYFGGLTGAIAGAAGGFFVGRNSTLTEIDKQVLTAQIQELQNELKSVAESGVLSEGEIAGIMNSKELENYTYDCYDFSGSKWGELMGNPGKKFHLMVFGRPKQGKSIFCVQFANYLSREHGKVLYIASEEGFSATLQKKIKEFGMSNQNLDFANFREYEQIRQALRGRGYKFVFIDSVNFIKITPEQVEALKAENPGAAFITVQQATKGGQFRGSQEFAHNCDMIVEVIAGQANHQGRYAGHTEMAIFDGPEQKEQPKQETEETSGRLEVSEISPEYGQMELF